MMKTLFLTVFALVSAFAQTSATNATNTPQVTVASQEDMKNLERKINKMKSEMVQAVDQAANRSEEEKREISRRYEKSIEDLTLALQKSQQEAKKEAKEREAAHASQERLFRYLAGGAILLVCAALSWFLFGNRRQKQTVSVSDVSALVSHVSVQSGVGKMDVVSIDGVLINPNRTTLKEALKKNKQQAFRLTLNDGREAAFVAILGEDKEPWVIEINGEVLDSPVKFENAKKSADKRMPRKELAS